MPGRAHQVPDALSRLISPDGNDDKAVNDEVPTYGDHEHALVVTRQRAANTPDTVIYLLSTLPVKYSEQDRSKRRTSKVENGR